MATSRNDAQDRDSHDSDALEHLADELGHDADAFTPDVESTPRDLPGRRPGAALASEARPTTGPAAVLLDIGTSRRDGFTHVLWVSHLAESLLGPQGYDELRDTVGTTAGVRNVEWEGADHLHVDAPDRDHEELLRDARAAVAELLD
ncbi:hypothetical protein [Demequina muriae]|uniref:Uncharacterized protein n=1 Tax=Demequina muriae TaxID=3051664 RepID=A0ABT8GGE8_9MICO|nr:hypothetical protein [Demequina sp. EGI L300058]MDN4480334.1 hypothetical protein [Demequina sp. EGI L300058]